MFSIFSIRESVFFLLGAFALIVQPLAAQEFDSVDFDDPVSVELIPEFTTVPMDQPLRIAVCLEMQKDWHSYWKNPGDAGMPTQLDWTLPEGFQIGHVQWPTPQRFSDEMGVGYGYEGVVCIIAELIPPADLRVEELVDIEAEITWLACGDSCVPGRSTVAISLPVASSAPVTDDRWLAQHDMLMEQLPEKTVDVLVTQEQGEWVLSFDAGSGQESVENAYFFAEEPGVIDLYAEQRLSFDGSSYKLAMTEDPTSDGSMVPDALRGVLVLSGDDAVEAHGSGSILAAWEVDTPFSAGTPLSGQAVAEVGHSLGGASIGGGNEPPAPGGNSMTLGFALVLAFVGGMILNLMPCVLPVISFKVMSFVKLAGEQRWEIFRQSAAFVAGVMISFWLLAGTLLTLRAFGQSVGWGFQLQEPLFVGLLALILVVFALSLFGVFELGASVSSWAGSSQQKSSGLTSSFFSGVLATAVATPCTGPFLGAAIGFAATLSAFSAMLVFTAMGLGLSLPYMLFAIFPSLLKVMPKPGPWMVTFKEFMGFLIAATVLWLVWVFGALTDATAVFFLLVSFMLAAVACWIYGKWGSPASRRVPRTISTVVSALILAAGAWQVVEASRWVVPISSPTGQTVDDGEWQSFSPEKLQELRAAGTPVFVDFTAKWCLICQANKAVLHSSGVVQKFKEKGVVTMEADWTRNDPVITEALREFGRNGVPLYLLYGAAEAKPKVLSQVLTPEAILDCLEDISDATHEHQLVDEAASQPVAMED